MPSSKFEPVGTLVIAYRGRHEEQRIKGVRQVDFLALLNVLKAHRTLAAVRDEMHEQPEEPRRAIVRQTIRLPEPSPPQPLPKKFSLVTYHKTPSSGSNLVAGRSESLEVTKIGSVQLIDTMPAHILS
jgi:hypothetical protein